jgi:hypothetical protein
MTISAARHAVQTSLETETIMKKLPITKMQQIKTTRAVTIIAHYCLVAAAAV